VPTSLNQQLMNAYPLVVNESRRIVNENYCRNTMSDICYY